MMMKKEMNKADYVFEVSWEICNMVGGIYTVLSTKALSLKNDLNDNYILIGPDVWRDSAENPEFIEDKSLFPEWQKKAAEENLFFKIGRWDIAASPIAIIVDFTPYFSKKDVIFTYFWEKYKLDSIHGEWDYIEPALFGYAAAKIIESFTTFNIDYDDKVVAHFHEWMCGGGLLYLNDNMSRIATVFTTHATVLGRTIAGNNLPLYGKLEEYVPRNIAKDFNVVSKHSLEYTSAKYADSFLTVSDITAKECVQFHEKAVDEVTPNGFDDSFVPKENFDEKRKIARSKMLHVAEVLSGKEFPEDTFIIGTSGRYEYSNKGLDVFLDALSKLTKEKQSNRKILAYITVPANHLGSRKELKEALENGQNQLDINERFITHKLVNQADDPIVKKLKELELDSADLENFHLIFVPSYLNGKDGIFNLKYYDLLIGQDLTVYASYYEPWGYTPLESLAFSVPTITTSLAGFGLWVNNLYEQEQPGAKVIYRDDDNKQEVSDEIAKHINTLSNINQQDYEAVRKNAFDVSRVALWENLITHYYAAYDIAIEKVIERTKNFMRVRKLDVFKPKSIQHPEAKPVWSRFIIGRNIPNELKALEELAENLWWSWNPQAEELFECIDNKTWIASGKNPIVFLDRISYRKYLQLTKNEDFRARLKAVSNDFKAYMQEEKEKQAKIAYFSMEFGLHHSLKIYSGGLGVLAGDYMKEASDLNKDIVGIGLLYKYGYFKQLLSRKGEQVASQDMQDLSECPIKAVRDENGNWKSVSIVLPGRTLKARIWKVDVGRVQLYLLDTDFEENNEFDRSVTHHLYGGDRENRFKQELLLGVGGVRMLQELDIKADVFHLNEGHAAFSCLERLRQLIVEQSFSFEEAVEIVRASSLFTTHTPVPAGHDFFDEDLLRTYMAHYPSRLSINWDRFMNLGKSLPNDPHQEFSMSFLAANLSQEINGVSKLHGDVSKEIFRELWPAYFPEELHLSYVTNGVHLPTWISNEWRNMLEEKIDVDFINKQSDRNLWDQIDTIDDETIWKIRMQQKEHLYDLILERLNKASISRHESPNYILKVKQNLNKEALTIGFARRFASYKRALLLFRDIERLKSLLRNEEMPVQFIFAGKAHPNDGIGQDLLRQIVELSNQPEFLGKIIFLSNYDIEIAKRLISGVDIWMNTPTRKMEASGTSGEKAVMNGVLHFSVMDGWWMEGYKEGAGWALSDEKVYENQEFQNDLDAEIIYNTLEEEIIPSYYSRDKKEVPNDWIRFIRNSMKYVAPEFTMRRMWEDYIIRFYSKLYKNSQELKENNYEKLKTICSWKEDIKRNWNSIEILHMTKPDVKKDRIIVGEKYSGEIILDCKEINPDYVGVELVITAKDKEEDEMKVVHTKEFNLVQKKDNTAQYTVDILPNESGVFDIAVRIFPKHEFLPHRQDFALVKWA